MSYFNNNILQAGILATASFFGCNNSPSSLPPPERDSGLSLDTSPRDTGVRDTSLDFDESPRDSGVSDTGFDTLIPDTSTLRDISGEDRSLRLPNLRLETPYVALPTGCGLPSDLFVSREVDGRDVINIICADNRQIYFFNPMEARRPIAPRARSARFIITLPDGGILPQFPGVAISFEGTQFIIMANNGFYIGPLETEPTRIVSFIPFPSGRNTGGGAAYFPGHRKLLVTTANIATGSSGITYDDGTVLVHEVIDRSSVVRTPMHTITTSQKNPTGIIALDENRAAVLNSGPFNSPRNASVDIIDVRTMTILRTIPLGAVTASLSGRLALTEEGQLAIGTSNGDHRFFLVNPNTGELTTIMVEGEFHGSINTGAFLVWVSFFNEGRVIVFNPTRPEAQASMSLGFRDSGTALFYGGCLLQTGPSRIVRICPE